MMQCGTIVCMEQNNRPETDKEFLERNGIKYVADFERLSGDVGKLTLDKMRRSAELEKNWRREANETVSPADSLHPDLFSDLEPVMDEIIEAHKKRLQAKGRAELGLSEDNVDTEPKQYIVSAEDMSRMTLSDMLEGLESDEHTD